MFKRAQNKFYSTSANLLKTPLHEAHVEFGGKMVPYAGFEMPVLYKDQSHIESHNWVRSKAGLFDVSHMLQHTIQGPQARALLEKITPIDLGSLGVNQLSLSVLLNNEGGVIDDCIITKHGDNDYYMVTNAGCREKDVKFIKDELTAFDVNHSTFEGTLLAVQGPQAAELLQKFTTEDLSKVYFGESRYLDLKTGGATTRIHLARSGYTGEDGFELSIPSGTPAEQAEALSFFKVLINEYPDIAKPIGLAARDSLRLEAGMCLYGHELTEEITPIQASLAWLIPKSRRADGGFNGSSKILGQLADKSSVTHRRIGVKSKGPSPRDGNKIFNAEGKEIGYITSGSPSPTLGGNVAQAYIDKSAKIGSGIKIEIRGKLRDGEVAKLPFVPSKFYKG
ncbi:aminomethyltransferase mitochondrial precursor [Suhomyces tanzawaensis NRRL Y-17324]|uniref:Aminomethyltransferase n=1 Tax=Suhomyces tanzawaensis NRRL Y-17324 TaxID=984487 RepID=A0A1E4SQY5_9ASCO|nr:aminomethyltransferase mitochondrial precursor [Suhomyces tanzawaensis NRRL Y-17324]ODV81911.1 aminomethyltransferase mitochondrial precursor [Suhomyces tanzawaensis NRRL Y-17324]